MELQNSNKRKFENYNCVPPKKRKFVHPTTDTAHVPENFSNNNVRSSNDDKKFIPRSGLNAANNYLRSIEKGYYDKIMNYDNFDLKLISKSKLLPKLFDCANIDIIKYVFDNGINQNSIYPEIIFKLVTTLIKSNEIDKILFLIDLNLIRSDFYNFKGNTLLHIACFNTFPAMAKIFLNNGFEINKQNNLGQTALHIACERKSVELVQILMDSGADPNIKEYQYLSTPIFTICKSPKCLDIIKIMIDKIDLEEVNGNKQTIFHLLCSYSELDSIKYIAEKIKSCDRPDKYGMTPIHLAVLKNRIFTVEYLVNANVDFNCKNSVGYTPLHIAVKCINIKISKFLIGAGANINTENKIGTTPLHTACDKNSHSLIKLLIESGANPNVIEHKFHITPIFCLQHYGNIDLFKLIINKVSDINHANFRKQTLLHIACYYGSTDIVRYLIAKGANIKLLDVEGCSPLTLAYRQKHFEIVNILIDNGAEIDLLSSN